MKRNKGGKPFQVGMFYNQPAFFNAQKIMLGYKVAIVEYNKAILRYSNLPLLFSTAPIGLNEAKKEIKRHSGIVTEVVSYNDLLEKRDSYEFLAWHDVASDVNRPFHTRRLIADKLYPITINHHGSSYQYQRGRWFLPLLTGDVYPCDSIICSTRSALDLVRSLLDEIAGLFNHSHKTNLKYRGRLDCIPLGVNTDLYRPRPGNKKNLRRRLKLPTDSFIILWLGRLSALDKADLLPLLLIFKELINRHPRRNILLFIGGSERMSDSKVLEHYAQQIGIADNVKIEDINTKNNHLYYSASDVFVSPVDTPQESFGITPVEAMASGIPQVVSDWDGYRDTVVDGRTGFLIPVRWTKCDNEANEISVVSEWGTWLDQFTVSQSVAPDFFALLNSLNTLINNDALREKMSKESRTRAVSEFSWATVISRYESLWHELFELSQNSSLLPVSPDAYEYPSFFHSFKGYASEIIDDNSLIAITEIGRAVVLGEIPLPVYYQGFGIHNFDMIKKLLAMLSIEEAHFGSLAAITAKNLKRTDGYARRHIMWLVKYGFAAISP